MVSVEPDGPGHAGSAGAASTGMPRRGVIRAAGAGALALGLGGAAAGVPAARAAVRNGPAAGAAQLPAGFWKTFTSRFINAGGLRQHVVTGGDGPPLLLVHGWPQTWYAWRLVMPALARQFHVIAPDQRGRGLSGKPRDGYDTGTLARDLAALMGALGHRRFAVAGHDTGMDIAYALAADHRDRVAALEVAEAVLPGVQQSPPLFVDSVTNEHLFHLMFNKLPAINEQLVRGREDIYFSFIFDVEAGSKKLPPYAVRTYIDNLASVPGALRGSFGFYRALDATTAQNAKRATRKLTIPVLAIGGEESLGAGAGNEMKLAARDVRTVVIPGAGHWVAEQAPDQVVAALTAFLAPYRAAHAPTAADIRETRPRP
jgi:pimeloyl-ACP methyl ester carboxylesterase